MVTGRHADTVTTSRHKRGHTVVIIHNISQQTNVRREDSKAVNHIVCAFIDIETK